MTLKEVLESVREEVIKSLRKGYCHEVGLFIKKKFYAEKLDEIFASESYERLKGDDIYQYPLEIIYLLYCREPVDLRPFIEDERLYHEYWDFFLENYQGLEYDGKMGDVYNLIKKVQ